MRRSMLSLLLFASLVALAGCSDSDSPAAPADDTNDDQEPGGIPTDLTDPAAVLDSHFLALELEDLGSYVALLEAVRGGRAVSEPGFRFYVRDDDAIDFPWLEGDSWGLDVEQQLIGHMFDSSFSGENPPVTEIRTDHDILDEHDLGEGLVQVTADAFLTVLTGPNSGWHADTRFEFTLAEQPDGFLRIRSIAEVPKLSPRTSLPVEGSSWGQIKALYR